MAKEEKELVLSFNRIGNAECMALYNAIYNLHVKDEPGPYAILGSLCHGALEFQGQALIHGQEPKKLLEYLEDYLAAEPDPEDKHAEKAKMPSPEIFAQVKEILSAYEKKDYAKNKVLESEIKFKNVLDNGVIIGGKIDRVEETEHGIEIIDFKTNNMVFADEEVKNSLQLGIYALAAKSMFPGKEITCTFDFLRYGRKSVIFNDEEIETFKDYLAIAYRRISEETEFKATLCDKCMFCPVKADCELMHEFSAKAEEQGGIVTKEMIAMNDADLVDEYNRIQNMAKYCESYLKELKYEMTGRLGQSGTGQIEAGGYIIGTKTRNFRKVRAHQALRLVEGLKLKAAAFDDLFSVSLGKLEKVIGKEEVKKIAKSSPGNPYLVVEGKQK